MRSSLLVREAPVTALFILIAVCLSGLGIVLRDPFALVSVAPLAVVLALYFRQTRSY
ncbi:MAG TPA: hypothetical protein VGL81_27765 [Polyangiaceae bacterium]|jgi:hypothetical protein